MILDGVISLLLATPGITAIATGGVFKNLLPRGYVLPAIVVHRYGGELDYDFQGPVGVRTDRIQIDAYALPANCEALGEAILAALEGFTGTLPDGTVVQAAYLDRYMDLPFLPNADKTGMANRTCLGFRLVSAR